MPHLFKSKRLGFRNWLASDIDNMSKINLDEKVMEFFPHTISRDQTIKFIKRMQNQYDENGFCYFAANKLENNEFIGFIGLSEQTFEAEFTPCLDIGWRLASKEWNKGYATEGALRCLEFAFNDLKLDRVCSFAPKINTKSEDIMVKIGMTKLYEFEHPKLIDDRLKACVLYEKVKIT